MYGPAEFFVRAMPLTSSLRHRRAQNFDARLVTAELHGDEPSVDRQIGLVGKGVVERALGGGTRDVELDDLLPLEIREPVEAHEEKSTAIGMVCLGAERCRVLSRGAFR